MVGQAGDAEFEDDEDAIPASADVGRSDGRHVSHVEACIFNGGEERLRVRLSLDVGQGDRLIDIFHTRPVCASLLCVCVCVWGGGGGARAGGCSLRFVLQP